MVDELSSNFSPERGGEKVMSLYRGVGTDIMTFRQLKAVPLDVTTVAPRFVCVISVTGVLSRTELGVKEAARHFENDCVPVQIRMCRVGRVLNRLPLRILKNCPPPFRSDRICISPPPLLQ